MRFGFWAIIGRSSCIASAISAQRESKRSANPSRTRAANAALPVETVTITGQGAYIKGSGTFSGTITGPMNVSGSLPNATVNGRVSGVGTVGNATATSFGRQYAIMKALDAKGQTGALPYGAPKGGTGTAAYLYTLAAANNATSQGVQRGTLALGLALLAALGSGYVVRRRIVTAA